MQAFKSAKPIQWSLYEEVVATGFEDEEVIVVAGMHAIVEDACHIIVVLTQRIVR